MGYFFGRHIHRECGVPVGLINSSWGGTRIEPWVPPVGFRSVPELKEWTEKVDRVDPAVPAGRTTWETYLKDLEQWLARAKVAIQQEGGLLPDFVALPGFTNSGEPTAIYSAMVYPLAPYGLRGAIWYQGESNGGEGVEYFHKMQALIQGWHRCGIRPSCLSISTSCSWQTFNSRPTIRPAVTARRGSAKRSARR